MKQIFEPILVLGANGKTGSRILNKLNKLKITTRKGSRTAAPNFDWENRATWEKAISGIGSVYIAFQPDLAIPGAQEEIQAFVTMAQNAGVKKLVLLSGRGEPEAQACEEITINSGLKWTIVRSSWFNQNFNEGFLLDPLSAGLFALPVGDVREPFVDADDIADVAVAALTDDRHDSKIYEVTGPRLLSFKEAVYEISLAVDRPIQYVKITLEEYSAQLLAYEVPVEVVAFLSYLFTEVLDGRNEQLATGVYDALGRQPKDFSEFAGTFVLPTSSAL